MTNYDATVTLDISTAANNPDSARYHRPTVGGNPVSNFWYGYTGGTDGWGGLVWTHGTARKAKVQLSSTLSGYKITGVDVTTKGGANKDVSAKRIDDLSWEIDDTGADIEEGRFAVTVKPPGSDPAMKCDPIWRNQ